MTSIKIKTLPFQLDMSNNNIENCKTINCTDGIFSVSQPSFYANRNLSQQTTTSNVLTPVLFDNIIYNKNNCVSYNNINGQITVLKSGLYSIYSCVSWQSIGTGSRLIELFFSDANTQRQAINITPSQSATPMYSTTSMTYYFNTNDVFSVRVLRSSVPATNILNNQSTCIILSQIC